jgi:Protein of unknown function (DUF3467)
MYVESEILTSTDPIEARYANFFRVGHNSTEFVLEFGQVYSDSDIEVLHTRIVTNPTYARVFLAILSESVEKYERVFGPASGEEE